jgi:hypothetical protein
VLAIVDFDMRFTYASIRQPGSMHDTSVLFHALEHDRDLFPHPPSGKINILYDIRPFQIHFVNVSQCSNLLYYFALGKYYTVDAGYPNRPRYLAHTRVKGIMFLTGERVLHQMVSKSILIICTQVFLMQWNAHLVCGK